MRGVTEQRADAAANLRFRLTGGQEGTAPAGHIAAERRNIIGSAAARIMRKKDGAASAGTQIANLRVGASKRLAFIDKFRKASIRGEFPAEYLTLTVQQALDAGGSK